MPLCALSACALIFSSCTEKDGGNETGDVLGFAQGTSATVAATPERLTLNVQNWSEELVWDAEYLTEDSGWLNIEYAEGVFSLKVFTNHSDKERSAEITVTTTFEEATFRITQQAGTGEAYDPFVPDFPDEYFLYDWNDSWTVWNWIYKQGHNSNPTDGKLKYEALNYGENGLPWHDYFFYLYETSGKVSVGLKLSEEILELMRGKLVSQIACLVTNQKVTSATLSVVTLKKSDNPNLPAWVDANDCWSVDEVIFEQDVDPQSRKDWLFLDLRDEECGRVPADAENVMVLVTMEGDGTISNGGMDAMFWAAPQPISKFAPTYINPDNSEGKDMYLFKGGTVGMNFVWVNTEQQ